jgi:hypothetical protein
MGNWLIGICKVKHSKKFLSVFGGAHIFSRRGWATAALSHSESSGFLIAKRTPKRSDSERETMWFWWVCFQNFQFVQVQQLISQYWTWPKIIRLVYVFKIWMTFLKGPPISAMAMDTLMASSFNLLCHHVLSKWWTNKHKMGPSKRISAPIPCPPPQTLTFSQEEHPMIIALQTEMFCILNSIFKG